MAEQAPSVPDYRRVGSIGHSTDIITMCFKYAGDLRSLNADASIIGSPAVIGAAAGIALTSVNNASITGTAAAAENYLSCYAM